MDQVLLQAADASGVVGAVVEPEFPAGFTLGWAPPSPGQWAQGQRVYACTLAQPVASPLLYAVVFTHGFPTEDRTCIDNASLIYVDCARDHDRERIAEIDVTAAVRAGVFPGTAAIKARASGRFVDFDSATFAALDRACTTYLRAVSTTTKLTGVAEPEVDQWPTPTGRFRISCEADAAPTQRSVVTQGSVYDR